MPTKYYELTEVEGFDGRLFVYKRTVDANVWNFRANIDGVRGYIRRSTKQANLTLAISEAKNGYIQLVGRQRQHLTILKTKFDDVFNIWLKEAKKRKTDKRYSYTVNIERLGYDCSSLKEQNKKIAPGWYDTPDL